MSVAPPASAPPRWARFIDLACLLLFLLAVVVALSGGFRARPFGVLISLRTPGRIFLAALVLAVVRHALAPQGPVYRDLPARLRAAWQTTPVRAAMSALTGTRLAVLFVGYMAVFLIGYANPEGPPFRLSENEIINLQARWDTGWYLGIATRGYDYRANRRPEAQQNIVFFPALPMAVRVTSRLLGGTTGALVLAGTVVVLLAFAGALIYLFRFARDVLGDEDRARHTLWLVAAYPFAVFFSSIYAESIFLLGAVGAFYHLGRGEHWRAGVWGLLVGLTRPNGCFLSIPLFLLAIAPLLPAWVSGGAAAARRTDMRRIIRGVAAAAMPGIGVLLYSAYIWNMTGNPLTWAEGHLAWGRSYQGLSVLVTDRYEYLSEQGLYAYTSQLSLDLVHALAVIFVLASVWGVFRRLGLAYAVFILINILPPLAAGGLMSAGRLTSVLFPAFIWLATVTPARHRTGWIATFMAVQALNAAMFYTWRPMF